MFNIDLDKLARLLLPTKLRGDVILAYVKSILEAFKASKEKYLETEYNARKAFIQPNAQTLVFENHLNRFFATQTEKIWIQNVTNPAAEVFHYNQNEGFGEVYYYNENEGEEPIYLYNENEVIQSGLFIVHYPCYIDTANETDQLIAQIEIYKAFGTTYQIQCYGSTIDPR